MRLIMGTALVRLVVFGDQQALIFAKRQVALVVTKEKLATITRLADAREVFEVESA